MMKKADALKLAVLDETKRHNGSLKLNPQNQQHFDYLVEILGGTDKIKKKAPGVYALLQKQSKEGLKDGSPGKLNGLYDSVKVRNMVFYGRDANELRDEPVQFRIDSDVSASYVAPKEGIIVNIDVFDEDGRPIFNDIADVDQPVDNVYSAAFPCAIARELPEEGKTYQVMATFIAAGQASNGRTLLQSQTSYLSQVYIAKQDSFVDAFKTVSPILKRDVSKDSPEYRDLVKDKIVVAYQRSSVIKNWDYSTDQDLITGSGDDEKIQVWLPVEFSFSVKGDYFIGRKGADGKPDPQAGYLDKETGFRLEIERLDGKGGVVHNFCNFEDIKQTVEEFDKDGYPRKVSWKMPELWHDVLLRQGLVNRFTGADIYSCFHMQVSAKKKDLDVVTTLIMESMKVTPTPTTLQSKALYIQWGCLDGDTMICLAGGSQKRIKDIQLGDLVYSMDKAPAKVINIYSGTDNSIYRLTTESGKTVLASKTHPLFIDGEMKKACDVRIGDRILTRDGYETVMTVHINAKYRKKVYNLVFEKETAFFGNDIVVGDFAAQQRLERVLSCQEEKPEFSEATVGLYKEMKLLAQREQEIVYAGCAVPESYGLHYFAVKTIALLAGFAEGDAQRIAEYSQFTGDQAAEGSISVSEIPEELQDICTRQGDHWDVPVYPTAMKDWNDLNEVRKKTVQEKILTPFHYYAPDVKAAGEDDPGYRVVFNPARLQKSMREVVKAYQKAVSGQDADLQKACLMKLGMLMHILCDTYLHQNLCGIDNWRNNLTLIKANSDVSYADLTGRYKWADGSGVTPAGHTQVKYVCNDSWVNYIYGYPLKKEDKKPYTATFTCRNDSGLLTACKVVYGILLDCLNRGPVDEGYWSSTVSPVLFDGFHQETRNFNQLVSTWTNRYPAGNYQYDGAEIFDRLKNGDPGQPEDPEKHYELFQYTLFVSQLLKTSAQSLAAESKSSIKLLKAKEKDGKYVIKPKKKKYTMEVKGSLPFLSTGLSSLTLELYDMQTSRVIQTAVHSGKGNSVTTGLELDKDMVSPEAVYLLRAAFDYADKKNNAHSETQDFNIVFQQYPSGHTVNKGKTEGAG